MFSLDRSTRAKRPGSNIALAVALLCGTAMTAGVYAEPAQAQKKKEKERKPDYTKEFVQAFQAAEKLLKADPKDVAGARAMIPDVLAKAKTADDRLVAGQLQVNVGVEAKDSALHKAGVDMMIDSGRLAADEIGRYYYTSGQIAYQMEDLDAARARFEQALGAGFDGDLQNIIASIYFQQDAHEEGVAYYRSIINADIAAGRVPREDWLQRAFSSAYNNDLGRDAIELAAMTARYHPSDKNWRNAIGVQRNYIDMEDDVLLDLMRLAHRTGTMQGDRDYADYIEAADARKLPNEVMMLVSEATKNGVFKETDVFVRDTASQASSLIKADRAELPALERDARLPGATAVSTTIAGDVFLNFGEIAKAEELYTIAASKSGANMNLVMTRLGITQFDQGKYSEAVETFKKVGGARKAVASLWQTYAESKMNAESLPKAASDTSS